MENKIENFFFAGNAVSGEPDYEFAETFVCKGLRYPQMYTKVCKLFHPNTINLQR